MIALMAAIAPNLLSLSNGFNVARAVSINAVLAAGMTLVILTGGIDLSVGSVIGVAGVTSVLLWNGGAPSLVAVLGGILVGAAGLAGVMFRPRRVRAAPAGEGYELAAIAAVVLGGTSLFGGRGRIHGTFVGALIIGVLSNGLVLMNVPFFTQLIIKGAVIIVAVALDSLRNWRSG
jgi:ribose/xylose/arabinose/galactoside ABC-type transport system permease subunit